MNTPRFFATIVLLACAYNASAHDTWLLASDYAVETGETVTLGMTSGMDFPNADYAIKPERVALARMRLGGETGDLAVTRRGEHALHFSAEPSHAGVAVFRVSLAPNPIELTPEDVHHYLTEIGAPEDVWAAWRAVPEPKEWHELYTKHALAYVRVGEPAETGSWPREPADLPLAFVPQQDPTALAVGDTLVLQVLKGGEPYPGFSVGVTGENIEQQMLQADTQGKVYVDITAPGKYLLRGTDIAPPDRPDEPWKSQFTTVTFAVRP